MEEDVVFSNLRDKLFTAVVGDARQDGMAAPILPQAIGPLTPDSEVCRPEPCRSSRPTFLMTARARPAASAQKPFGLMLGRRSTISARTNLCRHGRVVSLRVLGQLMSTRARYLRAAGAVLNGFVRDAAGIEALGFRPSAADYTRKIRGRAGK
jgi:hypothetical protein